MPRLFQCREFLQRLGGLLRHRVRCLMAPLLGRTAHRPWRWRRHRGRGQTILLRCGALTNPYAGVGLWVSTPSAAATWHREEALEEGIEGREVLVRFDQCGAQGKAQQLAVMQAHQADAV